VVLFAGFERPAKVAFDPNLIHYHEVVLTGSEWIGLPPHHRPELYQQAIDLIAGGIIPVGRLITGRFKLAQIEAAFKAAADRRSLKVIVEMNYPSP
jgi:L-iditol 2-dehydrogenase